MSSSWRKSPYYRPSLYSLALHIGLFILLTVGFFWLPEPTPSVQPAMEIIQASVVNEQQYQTEIKKIEQAKQRAVEQEKQRQAAEKAAQLAEQRKAEALKQQQLAEQKRAEEKIKAEAEIKRQAAEAAQLAEEQKVAEAAKAEQQAKEEAQRLEEQRKAQEEAEQLEAQRKAEEEAKRLEEQRLAEEAKRLEEQRKAQEEQLMQQQLAAEQQALAAQQQAMISSELNNYKALINQKISGHWNFPIDADPHLQVRLAVRVAPDGSVLSASIRTSSGNSALDQSALDAVYKASPLPVPSDPAVFNEMRNLDIILSPQMRQ